MECEQKVFYVFPLKLSALLISILENVTSLAGIALIISKRDRFPRCLSCNGNYDGWGYRGYENYYSDLQVPLSLAMMLALWLLSSVVAMCGIRRRVSALLMPLIFVKAVLLSLVTPLMLFFVVTQRYSLVLGCALLLLLLLATAYTLYRCASAISERPLAHSNSANHLGHAVPPSTNFLISVDSEDDDF